jgi:DNA (cytosine-5)-methyltransferase 1
VLAHHYPSTPNLGDMTKFKEWSIESNVDLLVGGTPCQSFSVAGLRKGLDDPRGNLMLTYLAIADKYKPKWIVWENVPGVLSSNGGKDFGVFLGALGELGYGFAYRVLDAQYFGVAQRRRRVFVVGYLGDWRRAAAVLFERHSLQGHPAPSREKREDTSATITARTGVSRNNHEECVTWPAEISSTLDTAFSTKMGLENQHVNAGCPLFVPAGGFYETGFAQYQKADVGGTIKASGGALGGGSETFLAQPIAFSGQMSNPQTDVDMTQTLQAKNPMAVCLGGQHPNAGIGIEQSPTLTNAMGAGGGHIPITNAMAVGTDLYNGAITGDVAVPMTNRADGTGTGPTVMQAMAVRRLTPVECERLQGFPDSYTDIKSKNKPTPDGPRYKALGNSMAVPVMAWIGQRIEQVEVICKQNK